ncbi:MAG: hypothetical protein R3D51_17070 [Hyphomicrobiaceae bacterium]
MVEVHVVEPIRDSKAFFYDGVGNRTSETFGGVTDTYSYPSTSNLLQGVTRSPLWRFGCPPASAQP